ncbi:kinase-like protein [Peniophora sp. CONT]|nr:kinase-like protein [Peniophora sp. CONT]
MVQRLKFDPNDFVFQCDWSTSDNPAEPMELYGPGGFHPIFISQHIISPTTDWRVMHKLGHGSYATVWLVQNSATFTWAALRIDQADHSSPGETDVLESLSSSPSLEHPVTIIETFWIQGPNGTHRATVTEVVAPLKRTLSRLSTDAVGLKRLVRGIVEGVVEIHARGIIHCDLHLVNMGIALPELSKAEHTHEEAELVSYFDAPKVTLVVPQNPMLDLSHHPPYVVESCDMGEFHEQWRDRSAPDIAKFYDFGNGEAHLESKPHAAVSVVNDICPPEWAVLRLMGKDHARSVTFTSACDIWALGINILSIMSNARAIFNQSSSWHKQVCDMVELGGNVPSCWEGVHPDFESPELLAAANRSDEVWAKYRARMRTRCASEEDADALVAMLRRILVLDPAARPDAAEILLDPWFALS